jgi:release factor glutamine methyltransferase
VPTLGDALRAAARRLECASPSARLDAEILLAHVLGKSRTYLRAWPEASLEPEPRALFEALIERRVSGAPVAYLTGSREFWSRDFIVTPAVLIPRPETELLVEIALAHLREHPTASVLDLATGSGAIAVTLATEYRTATVSASDVSAPALAVARRNAQRHAAQVRLFESDWFAGLPAGLEFDLIVSNPPYIPDADPHLGEGDLRFEPPIALQGGPDGIAAYRTIAEQARVRLRPKGVLLLEHGFDQADAVGALLTEHRYRHIDHHADLQGHLRLTRATAPER